MKFIKKLTLPTFLLLFLPFYIANAQRYFGNEFEVYGNKIIYFINSVLVPFILALALLVFIWGVYLYFFQQGGEEDSRKQGRFYMIWAVIGFVFIVSIWGLTNLIAGGLGLDDDELDATTIPDAPQLR